MKTVMNSAKRFVVMCEICQVRTIICSESESIDLDLLSFLEIFINIDFDSGYSVVVQLQILNLLMKFFELFFTLVHNLLGFQKILLYQVCECVIVLKIQLFGQIFSNKYSELFILEPQLPILLRVFQILQGDRAKSQQCKSNQFVKYCNCPIAQTVRIVMRALYNVRMCNYDSRALGNSD
eukprot:TRINITY_DN449_c0_g1_i5.p1 TRINITY_DN449_c0_g1~~TRINITY_DN449_c0_g1_i5.p1  ORF type:complete len:180 (-),score=5.10 TRINITY_DN449_c0_g1_i5:123-662(-)